MIANRVMPGRLVTMTQLPGTPGVAAGEPLEQFGQQFGRDTGTVVGDAQLHPRSRRHDAALHRRAAPGIAGIPRPMRASGRRARSGSRHSESDADRRACRGVLARVAQQVRHHLVQPVLIAADQDRLVGQVQPPAVVAAGDPGIAGRLDRQPGQVHGFALERPSRVEPGQQQQVIYQDGHPGRLRLDPSQGVRHFLGHRARVPQGQLGVAADRGQRGAQFVRGVGGEPAQPGFARRAAAQRLLDVEQHPVERGPDPAHLGPRVVVRDAGRQRDLAGIKRQLGHPGRGGGDPAQRPERELHHRGAQDQGQQQDGREDRMLGVLDVVKRVIDRSQGQPGDQRVIGRDLDLGEQVIPVKRGQGPGIDRQARRTRPALSAGPVLATRRQLRGVQGQQRLLVRGGELASSGHHAEVGEGAAR